MVPLRISLEGFMSYREKQEINFNGASLWMLWGPNGVGKSAIFDAITYALFNSHRAQNAKELINHEANKLIVEFDFLVDNVMYRIRRICPIRGQGTREAFILVPQESGSGENPSITPIAETDTEKGFSNWVERTIGFNYQAFTSSVMLLQGKSEQLLYANPKARYDILAELIDLSKYQRLFEAADEQRRTYKSRFETRREQLQGMSIVDEQAVALADAELKQQNEQIKTIQLQLEQLTGLREQAKQREQLVKKREEETGNLQAVEALLQREQEITAGYEEWQAIGKVIAPLNQIVTQRQQLVANAKNISELQQREQHLVEQKQRLECEREVAEQQATQQKQNIERIQGKQQQFLQRQTILGPMIAHLEHIERLQADLQQITETLVKFPTNLELQLQDAERRATVVEEYGRVHPWLSLFAQARTALAEALENEQENREQTDEFQKQLQDANNKRALLGREFNEAEQEERRLFKEKTRAEHECADVIKRLRLFDNAATKPLCEVCGQPINEDYAHQEHTRLQQQVGEKQYALETTSQVFQAVQENKKRIERDILALDQQIKKLTISVNSGQKNLQRWQDKAAEQARQMRNTYHKLPEVYRECITTTVPQQDALWLETTYPTESDLGRLELEIGTQTQHGKQLEELRKKHNSWQNCKGQQVLVTQQIQQKLLNVDIEQATRGKAEKETIEKECQALEREITQKRGMYQQSENNAERVRRDLKESEDNLQKCRSNLSAARATGVGIQSTIQLLIEHLPAGWQEYAVTVTIHELQQLAYKQDQLAKYQILYRELVTANETRNTCEQLIATLSQHINDFPSEAGRSVAEIDKELGNQRKKKKAVDTQRDATIDQLSRLKKQYEERQKLVKESEEAKHQWDLYKLLTEHLGRSGLQLYLLRQAEDAIVEFANRTLTGLSHGRLWLELRRESNQSSKGHQGEKALDLFVYDNETASHAMPLALVSGSQKFRVAVSLALAIGRFSSGNSRGVESVIIDEGFGSLDKNGRDDMIHELDLLGQQLSRIVLVSHQEEFAEAFRKRYSFELVNHSTQVKLTVGS